MSAHATTLEHDSRLAAAPRELDSRGSNGIHVQLLLHPHDGHDSVRHGHGALDVFHQPYADTAGSRGRGRLSAVRSLAASG